MSATRIDPVDIRNQVFLLEKAISSMRHAMDIRIAEAEGQLQTRWRSRHVPSALESFLTSDAGFDPRECPPNHRFGEGIWVSYDKVEGNGCALRAVSFPGLPQTGGASSCLVVAPWFRGEEMSQWVSVSTVLDAAALGGLASVKLRFVCGFRDSAPAFGDPAQAAPTDILRDNFVLALRIFDAEGQFRNIRIQSLPALDAPLPFEVSLPAPALEALAEAEPGNEVRLIFNLPVNKRRDYEFSISAFRVDGVAA
ncbi:hypothetical protein FDP22_05385 [Paroceanicella profunda]|uniref:Uncharacterized protein n=1 Tax=Paroceanicella profunda TaxID=2579971 RepID=A0A5B8FYL3_9RHOB|nr:hypothetical protein [Paroceanicella profunda]QDL91263.1 hypothetical protein FDP22_05385 [Paroceanicella profunda]